MSDAATTTTELERPEVVVDPTDKVDRLRDKKIAVLEIFGPTVQGEGVVIGVQTMFVRFGGCDYRCKKCDSLHAVLPELIQEQATYKTQDEILNELLPIMQQTGCTWVTLSGGNPAMWDLTHLCMALKAYGLNIAVETQGTLNPKWFEYVDVLTVSPKGPGMGEKFEPKKFETIYMEHGWRPGFNVKVVIFNMLDLDFATELNRKYKLGASGKLFLSLGNNKPPKFDEEGRHLEIELGELLNDYRVMVEEVLANKWLKDARVLPQFHVLLWGNRQGV